MTRLRMRALRSLCPGVVTGLGLAIAIASPVHAQAQGASGSYPNKPIRLVLGQSPGGAPDILARIVADHAGKSLGQAVVVEYKPSGGGVIAQDIVAKAAADGYTWLLATPTMMAVAPYLKRKLPFDPFKDFLPVSLLGQSANVLVVGPALEAKRARDLVDMARANPGKLQFASSGLGTTAHLAGALLGSLTDTEIVHIPYKGAAQGLNDVVAGTVHFMITSPAAAMNFMQSGRVKALATTGAQPDPVLPHLPLLGEDVPGYELVQWWGIVLRSGTPDPIAQKIHGAVMAALADERVRSLFKEQGVTPKPGSMAEFDAFIQSERVRYKQLIQRAKVQLED